MTDQEIISTWMEAKPDKGPFDFRPWRSASLGGWWVVDSTGDFHPQLICNEWLPRALDLDALWEVQARLSPEQWYEYTKQYACLWRDKELLHSTPFEKIRALAAVLRPLVEGKDKG